MRKWHSCILLYMSLSKSLHLCHLHPEPLRNVPVLAPLHGGSDTMAESRLSVLPPIKPKNLGDAYQFSKKEALRSNGALMQVQNMT